jgi:hypothetical protein
MRKTITTFLTLAVSLLCLLILIACPPGASSDTPGSSAPVDGATGAGASGGNGASGGGGAPDTETPGADTPGKIGHVIITNVPSTVKENGPEAFKIYVQLSTSMDDKDPHTAISSGKITDHKNPDGSITLPLYEDHKMTTPWKDSGKYYIAVTISPQNAPVAKAIQVKVPSLLKSPFSSETNTINWEKSRDLDRLGILGEPRIQAIYDRIIKEDNDIVTE